MDTCPDATTGIGGGTPGSSAGAFIVTSSTSVGSASAVRSATGPASHAAMTASRVPVPDRIESFNSPPSRKSEAIR